jgi:hypothetical protein
MEVLPMTSTTTTLTTLTPGTTHGVPPEPARGTRITTGLSARRWFLIAAPVFAGLFAIVGAAADPAVGKTGMELWEGYAANPDPLQFKSFGFHWSYAFWAVPALLMAAMIRRRGVWLANVGAAIGFVGLSTLPGLLVVDFYDSAIGQVAGAETTKLVNEQMETMWAVPAIVFPGLVCFMLALPIATAAAWRAGIVRWWALVAVIAAEVAFLGSGVAVWGTVVTTACFTVFAYALWLGTRPAPTGTTS